MKGIGELLVTLWISGKKLSAKQESWVQSLVEKDPLEKWTATHSSVLAWRIPWTEEPGGLQSMESQRIRRDWATKTLLLLLRITISKRTSVQLSWTVTSNSLWPMDCSMVGFPVHHQLPELAQTHVHQVDDAISTISSSVVSSSCLQSFPASGSFLRSQFFTSGGQRFEASASASALPMNI